MAEIAHDLRAATPAGFAVWPGNCAITDAWLVVASQWRCVPVGDGGLFWVGLDYMGAKASLELSAIALDPRQWSELRLMERAAATILNGGG